MSNQSSQHPTGEESACTKNINKRKRPYELWAEVSFLFTEKTYWTRLGKYRTEKEREIAKETYKSKYRFYINYANEKP